MRSVSITRLKATLSEQVRRVRAGEALAITDRGRPVAYLAPLATATEDQELRALEEDGLVRPGARPLPPDFWDLPLPVDAGIVDAVLAEREEGW